MPSLVGSTAETTPVTAILRNDGTILKFVSDLPRDVDLCLGKLGP
jgi:hypothetical protein